MNTIRTSIPEIMIFEPLVFEDARGCFFESFNQTDFQTVIGHNINFVQDNHSISYKNVLRGLHYQIKHAQEKLVRVTQGEIFDVAIDIRRSSPSFGQHVGTILSAKNRRQMWIPAGFAHGFLVLSDSAEVIYKVTDFYSPEYERCIIWNDSQLDIQWPIQFEPTLSPKDQRGALLGSAEIFD